MYRLAEKLKNLEPYEPLNGEYKIRLDANESFIKPDSAKAAETVEKVSLGRYPDPYAKRTIEAFASLYSVNENIVVAGNGSDELISIITSAFLEKGDKVLCFSPDFSMYSFYPYINELEVLMIEKDDDFNIDFDYAAGYINENGIKCVMFSNPCNPTSTGFEAEAVRRFVKNTNALVVLDEAYMEFYCENESLLCETEKYDNLIVLKTCSKALALAGIRLGFAVSSQKLAKALRAAKSPYNVNVITQEIGTLVLSDKACVSENIKAVKNSVEELYGALKSRNYSFFERIYETKTNFVFIKSKSSEVIFKFLLKNGIAVRHLGGYLRITCGTADENKALIEALNKWETEKLAVPVSGREGHYDGSTGEKNKGNGY